MHVKKKRPETSARFDSLTWVGRQGQMILRLQRSLAVLAVLCLPCLASAATGTDAFATLRRLTGEWETKTQRGSAIHVSYRTIAAGSVLVETFTTASGAETLTVYHRDGRKFIATHYCGQGNQPRLLLESAGESTLDFAFYDVTNLAGPDASHLTRLQFHLIGDDRFDKTETYTEGTRALVTVFHFSRAH